MVIACSPGLQPVPTRSVAATVSPLPTAPTSPMATPAVPIFTYTIVNTYPHDRSAFTEGLEFENGFLYESTGLNGQSSLRRVDLESGKVLQSVDLSAEYFGEGITLYANRIIQLTWKSHVGFVYDQASFKSLTTFNYPTEGWGLTHDSHRLIMSDGTATLHFLDPETFKETGRVEVKDNGQPVVNLNELEYVHGEIFANVWQTDRIVRIAPETGQATGWIDLTGLLTAEDRRQPVDVLNGIAYDAQHDRLFVTGKFWPKLFEITLSPRS
jgi:glutamine cyclotransferase